MSSFLQRAMVSGKAERHLHDLRACQPLVTQSTFEDLAVDFEGTTASGAERFYRRTLDKLRLKLLESGVIHTVTLKQTDMRKKNKKIAAAVYLYQADNDGEWGELRFDLKQYGGDRKAGGLGYREIQHLCKNGDPVCSGLTGDETAEIYSGSV